MRLERRSEARGDGERGAGSGTKRGESTLRKFRSRLLVADILPQLDGIRFRRDDCSRCEQASGIALSSTVRPQKSDCARVWRGFDSAGTRQRERNGPETPIWRVFISIRLLTIGPRTVSVTDPQIVVSNIVSVVFPFFLLDSRQVIKLLE